MDEVYKEEKCPICKGEGFLKSRRVTIQDIEYLFWKRCECMKRKTTKHEGNPFDEGGKNNAAGDTADRKG